jgi:prepilin-type N-terminal cleavage/methylation domain-containing protein
MRARAAFSLIELVISLAILSIGLVGAMRVFPVGLRASRRSEMSSRAVITAQRTLESYKLKSWEELTPGQTTTAADPFALEMAISTPAVEGLVDAERLKALRLTVRWQEDGRPRALAFVTHVRRPSPPVE